MPKCVDGNGAETRDHVISLRPSAEDVGIGLDQRHVD